MLKLSRKNKLYLSGLKINVPFLDFILCANDAKEENSNILNCFENSYFYREKKDGKFISDQYKMSVRKQIVDFLFISLYFFCFIYLSFLFTLSCEVKADSEKTKSVRFVFVEENKPEQIYLFPGRASLLSLPCPITKALIGSPYDIKAEVDKVSRRDIHILLKKWSSEPSNLILKCKHKVFLFSLIPTKNAHNDYVNVLGHISLKLFKVKSALPNTPSPLDRVLREKDFSIRKILDFSWEKNP